jgi:hypothetical protein
MYRMSQSYSLVSSTPSRLERIASPSASYNLTKVGSVAYSAAASTPQQSYSSPQRLFQPAILSFNYESVESQTYSHNDPTYDLMQTHQEYHFQPDNFLKPGTGSKFVGEAEEVREFVEETFEKMFNQPFPTDIKISVLNEKKFRKIAPNNSTIGLSINRRKHGLLSEIFILNDSLGRVMLTIGHELGHVMTETLSHGQDEEAKAYSFSYAWMEVIKQHNIANLGDALILEIPADNGLHDIAFRFVEKLRREGRNVWEIYEDLVEGKVSSHSVT